MLFDSILNTLVDPVRMQVRMTAGWTNAYRIVRAAREFVDSTPTIRSPCSTSAARST